MSYNTWGGSWGTTWDTSWGQPTEIAQAVHSGATRLWMYELYAESIEQDHKKRGINQPEPVVAVATPQPTPAKPKVKRTRRATAKLTPSAAHKPLPRYAPAFVKPIDTPSIIEYLAELAPLPRLSVAPKAKPITEVLVDTTVKKKKKQKEELEYLLLMAA